jgi:hypothetical protein
MASTSRIIKSSAACALSDIGSSPRHPAELSTGALGGVLGLKSAP